jgi:glutamate/tyrosine decarboxylase-like PLP-dependent enzyme
MGPLEQPLTFVPATKHYSWPKAAALLGLGQGNQQDVSVDELGRMDVAGSVTVKQ